jgi:predicted Zn-dependent peptidase
MPVNQGKLSIGFRTGTVLADGNFAQFALFNSLYGGSVTSKLFENVRERLSLCYYCSSVPDGHKGTMIVSSGIEVKDKQKAQDEILRLLDEVRDGVFTDTDISNARESLVNGYKTISDSADSMESWYMRRNLCGIVKTPEEVAADIATVTAEQIQNMAKGITLDTVYFLKGTLIGGGDNDESDE